MNEAQRHRTDWLPETRSSIVEWTTATAGAEYSLSSSSDLLCCQDGVGEGSDSDKGQKKTPQNDRSSPLRVSSEDTMGSRSSLHPNSSCSSSGNSPRRGSNPRAVADTDGRTDSPRDRPRIRSWASFVVWWLPWLLFPRAGEGRRAACAEYCYSRRGERGGRPAQPSAPCSSVLPACLLLRRMGAPWFLSRKVRFQILGVARGRARVRGRAVAAPL